MDQLETHDAGSPLPSPHPMLHLVVIWDATTIVDWT